MADLFTTTTAISNLVKTAFDRFVEYPLRAEPLFRQSVLIDKRPVQQAMPGSAVTLSKWTDLSVSTTALSEAVDKDAIALGNPAQVTVTPDEYGEAIRITPKAQYFAFSDIEPAAVNLLAWNMVQTLDTLVSTAARAGTNVVYAGASGAVDATGPTNAVAATDLISAKQVRYVVNRLRNNLAVPVKNGMYWSAIHPDVALNLRTDTGAANWRTPHEYQAANNIWAGETGEFEGAFFIESTRVYNTNDGTTSAQVYRNLFAGRQALVEAVVQEPYAGVTPPLDKFQRFPHLFWKGILGWSVYRQESLYRLETSANVTS